jgi:alpha-methylacyl-CoA racemase
LTPSPVVNQDASYTTTEVSQSGPLAGLRVIEFSGIGPGPHCAMLLSDMGAEVLRIDRPGGNGWPNPIVDRGRHSLLLDLRSEGGRANVLEAVERADVVIEGYRPGVMEGLGLGPIELMGRNARLIYGRMTGWGQTGSLAKTAGHDINYIALTGALAAITGADRCPTPPLNLVGDFGGGSLYLALGIVAALWERERSGRGQVVDAAIVDGVASMMTMFAGLLPSGRISLDPERNLLGGHAPFYRCYECADGKYISIGSLEANFYSELLDRIGAPEALRERQNDVGKWPERVSALSGLFRQRTRDEWCALLEGSDACFAPVLTYEESLTHEHMQQRNTYIEISGIKQAAPAPRFSRTPGMIAAGGDGKALLQRWARDHCNGTKAADI